MLGTMYYKALGVKQNLKEAVYFLEECSSRGHSDASEILARIYSTAFDLKDPKLADYYEQLSREQKKHNGGVVEDYGFDIDNRCTGESSKEKSRGSFFLCVVTLFAVIMLCKELIRLLSKAS
jgi:TPR repeat protein